MPNDVIRLDAATKTWWHKVQAVAISVVLLVATASATLGLALLTASNGPFAEATVQVQSGDQLYGRMTLAGRSSPGGTVDDLVLNAGHWAAGSGQVVLDGTPARGQFGPGRLAPLSLAPLSLAALSLAALVIAAAGALLPASWSARAGPAAALRAE